MNARRWSSASLLALALLDVAACSSQPAVGDAGDAAGSDGSDSSTDARTVDAAGDGSADASPRSDALPPGDVADVAVLGDGSAPGDASQPEPIPTQPCRMPGGVGAPTAPSATIPAGITRTIYLSTARGDDGRTLAAAGDMSTPWRTLARVQQAFDSGEIATRGTALLLSRGEDFYGRLDLSLPSAQRFGSTPALYVGAYGTGAMPRWINATRLGAPISMDASSATFAAPPLPTAGTNGGTLFDWRVFVDGSELPLARTPSCTGAEYPACNGAAHRFAIVSAVDAPATVGGRSTTVTKVTLPAGSITLPVPGPAYLVVMAYAWARYRGQVVGAETDAAGRPVLWIQVFENAPGGPVRASPLTLGTTLPAGWGAFLEGPGLPSNAAGEWSVTANGLVVRPPPGVDLRTAAVELGTSSGALTVEGFDGVTVQGVHFVQGVGAQVNLVESLGGGAAQNIAVTDNVFERPQFAGLQLYGGGIGGTPTSNIEVARNTVLDGWNQGLSVRSLTGAVIHHNRIERVGLGQYASLPHAIDASTLIQSTIEYNYIHDVGYIGIGGDSLGATQIRFNVIDGTNVSFGDGGAIYYNFDRGGVTVHRNVICHQVLPVNADFGPNATISAQGIYLDDNTSPALIEENTLVDVASAAIFGFSHAFTPPTDGGPLFYRDDGDGNASVVQDWHVIRGNVIVNATHGLQYIHGTEGSATRSCGTSTPTCPTRGLIQSLAENLFYTSTLAQTPVALTTLDPSAHDFGAFSGNLFAHRASQSAFTLSVNDATWRSNVPSLFTLTGWQGLGANTLASRCADCRESLPFAADSSVDAQCAGAVVAESRGSFTLGASSSNVTLTALSASEATADGFPASAMGVHRITLPTFGTTRANEWASASGSVGTVSAGQTYRFRFTARAAADATTYDTASVKLAPGGYYGAPSVPLDTTVRAYEVVLAVDDATAAAIAGGTGLTVLSYGNVEISAIDVDRVTCGAAVPPLVVTNLSTEAVTYTLPAGTWQRPDGTPVRGTVTVDPFYSAVLEAAP